MGILGSKRDRGLSSGIDTRSTWAEVLWDHLRFAHPGTPSGTPGRRPILVLECGGRPTDQRLEPARSQWRRRRRHVGPAFPKEECRLTADRIHEEHVTAHTNRGSNAERHETTKSNNALLLSPLTSLTFPATMPSEQ